jgi:hypothetical protein
MDASKLKVIKADGEVYLGTLGGKVITGMAISNGSINDQLSLSIIGAYFTKDSLAELVTIDCSDAGCAVSSRGLNDDEAVLVERALLSMQKAEKFALKRVICTEFSRLLGK